MGAALPEAGARVSRQAHFVVEDVISGGIIPDGALVLRDVGPWDRFPTVTNDIEHVVSVLIINGTLNPGQRLFYYDSDNHLDELEIIDGKFAGFKAVRP